MTHTRKTLLLFLFALLCISLIAYRILRPTPSSDILQTSQVIASKPVWYYYKLNVWLDSRFLAVAANTHPSTSDEDDNRTLTPLVYDTKEHTFREFPLASKRIRTGHASHVSMSSDAQWISWVTYKRGNRFLPATYEIVSSDGHADWRLRKNDNAEIVLWADKGNVLYRFVAHRLPGNSRQFTAVEAWSAIPNGSGRRASIATVRIPANALMNTNGMFNDDISTTTSETFVVHDPVPENINHHETVNLATYTSVPAGLREELHSVSLPFALKLYSITVSHDGNFVLWQVEQDRYDAGLSWLHRFLHFIPDNHDISLGMWISRADGSEMHEVGHVDRKADLNGFPRLRQILWLPDDRTISFEYQGELRTIRIR